MRVLHDHPARNFGDHPHAIARAHRGHRHHIARAHRIGHAGQRSRLAAAEADRAAGPLARNHRADPPVLVAERKVERDQFGLPAPARNVDLRHWPVPRLARAIADQPGTQRILRRGLQLGIKRCAHPQAAGIDAIRPILGLFAVLGDQAAAHFFHIVAHVAGIGLVAARDDPQRLGLGRLDLGRRGGTVLDHLVEHPVAPGDRQRLELGAAVGFGGLGQDRQEGRLVQFQIAHILAEIGARCGLHAERLPAQRDFVEIQLQDLLLGQHAFDPLCQDHFLELAGHRIFVAEQDVLGDLLGDRRSTLGAAARAHLRAVIDHGPRQPEIIDPAVRPESLVLGRKVGVDQWLGKIDEAQLHAVFAGIGIDDFAIHAAHHRGQRRLVLEQAFGRRQIAADRDPHHRIQRQQRRERIAEPAKPAMRAPVAAQPVARASAAIAHGRPRPAGVATDSVAQIVGIGGVSHVRRWL